MAKKRIAIFGGAISHARRPADPGIPAAVLVALLLATPTTASVITMQVSCTASGSNLVVRMVNVGDEAAQNVRASVSFLGQILHTDNIPRFPPNQPAANEFLLDVDNLKGTYPAVVVVDFEDLNSYPFSSVSIQQIRSAVTRPASLIAVFQGETELGRKAMVRLRVRNKSDRPIETRCRVVTPNELVAVAPEFTLAIPPDDETSAQVAIENFSGTTSSSYPVHALIEYDQEGEHFCIPVSTTLTIVPPPPATSGKFWIVLALVVAAACLFLVPQIRQALKKR